MNAEKEQKKLSKISDAAKGILCTREKIERTQKEILKIVESLLEDHVSCFVLTKACEMLSQADYSDVIEERNILNLCGYPLCSKTIQVSKQKYHISCKLNKVYDITERKCFCSNECYKASKFLKVQLSDEPVWMQDEPVNVTLLSDKMNRGSAGEEVKMKERISKCDIHPKPNVENLLSYSSKEMLLDEIRKCTSHMQDLVLRESNDSFLSSYEDNSPSDGVKNFKESANIPPFLGKEIISFLDMTAKSGNKGFNPSDKNSIGSDDDDDDDFTEELFFPRFESKNEHVHRCAPVVSNQKLKSPVLIDPLPKKINPQKSAMKNQVSLEFVKIILQQWMTYESLEFLISEKCPEPDLMNHTSRFEKQSVSEIHGNCTNLCMKLEKQDVEDAEIPEKFVKELSDKNDDEALSDKMQKEEEVFNKKISLWYKGEIPNCNVPIKNVASMRTHIKEKQRYYSESPKSDIKQENDEIVGKVEITPEPILPLVDSLSQHILRQQIVTERLKLAYLNILPLIGLHYKNVSDHLRLLLSSFKFSANNITFRPVEWKLLALILFRILMNKHPKKCDDSAFHELLEKSLLNGSISVDEIDSLIETVKQLCQ